MPDIIPLARVPRELVESLLDAAFGADRRARTAYRIREGTEELEGLSFAALDDDAALMGTIQAWPVALEAPGGGRYPLAMVGPVAVMPALQRAGIGRALMTALLSSIDPRAPLPMVMIGDPEYYGRFFGFSSEGTAGWEVPGPVERHRLLLRNPANLPLAPVGRLGPWPAQALR